LEVGDSDHQVGSDFFLEILALLGHFYSGERGPICHRSEL
jgi:hypothetical protein